MRLICHLKHSLGSERRRRFINPTPWLTNFLYIFCGSAATCPHIKNHSFFQRRLLLNLYPKTTIVADTALSKWPEILKYYRNRWRYDRTRISKLSTKTPQIITLFLLKITARPINSPWLFMYIDYHCMNNYGAMKLHAIACYYMLWNFQIFLIKKFWDFPDIS